MKYFIFILLFVTAIVVARARMMDPGSSDSNHAEESKKAKEKEDAIKMQQSGLKKPPVEVTTSQSPKQIHERRVDRMGTTGKDR